MVYIGPITQILLHKYQGVVFVCAFLFYVLVTRSLCRIQDF